MRVIEVGMRGRLSIFDGWQNTHETNHDKAVGTQGQDAPSRSVLLNWSTFSGNEQLDTSVLRLRLFNDSYAVLTLSGKWTFGLVFKVGFQKQAAGCSFDSWHAASVMVKHTINNRWAIAGQAEYYLDEYAVIVPTRAPEHFQTIAGSVNVDSAPFPNILWRDGARAFDSKDAVYLTQVDVKKTDGFPVVSAAVSF